MDGNLAAAETADPVVGFSGPRLAIPATPVFHLQRAGEAHHEIGEFRAWAGYLNYGSDAVTNDLVHFQHVLSFADTASAGRTGVHAHLAHAHIVIPSSGRGVFSYDGVITPAIPGAVIVQHGGTIHDQFDYSYAAANEAANRLTPMTIDPPGPDDPPASFSFIELFVPKYFANVEIIPPKAVTSADQASAWDHPYHAEGARFSIQSADSPAAGFHPVAGAPYLEVRDADTWTPSGGLVGTWIIRPAGADAAGKAEVAPEIPGERRGLEILLMVQGSAKFARCDGEVFSMATGDCLTCSQGIASLPFDVSADMRLLRFFIAAKVNTLRQRTPEEVARIEALGPAVITRREVRADDDTRPVNALHQL